MAPTHVWLAPATLDTGLCLASVLRMCATVPMVLLTLAVQPTVMFMVSTYALHVMVATTWATTAGALHIASVRVGHMKQWHQHPHQIVAAPLTHACARMALVPLVWHAQKMVPISAHHAQAPGTLPAMQLCACQTPAAAHMGSLQLVIIAQYMVPPSACWTHATMAIIWRGTSV